MINIAVLGFGTVGSGVYEVLDRNYDIICKKAREEIRIKYVLDLREFSGEPVANILTHDFSNIINDDEIKVVVEVMGGTGVAYTFVKEALSRGKHVVTSNKALVAAFGPELLQIAIDNKVNFLFEASVGGGIPILRSLNRCLTADKIMEITGILNGTTNYILSEMTENQTAFAEVLKEAQSLGFAEANPTDDVEGYDACRKIAILSSLAYGKTVNFEDIYTEGISKITGKDILYAQKMKSAIKLIGTSKNLEKGVTAMVAPVILHKSHPLSSVSGAFNAILIKGNVLGDTMYYGSGAGSLPTASAVISDVVAAIRHINQNVPTDWSLEKLDILATDYVPVQAMIRVSYTDKEKAKEVAKKCFKDCTFVDLEEIDDEFAIITPIITEKILENKKMELSKKLIVLNSIRMEGGAL